ncbi:glycoside hydrolase family 78 protein [Paenibacillus sp. J5C_2022]|uniref:alpha-L-rhamnosidase n=1 Tax=Paenibacillus sp. J5C2022 TaxID=2977129 RepID=UPI0021D18A64|nr:alpha-L-rhamnosidase [Paenibacillus sp. J5C2022]MCU6712476.1 glycoside hydrolase family 78 protein [Paenibacillus sp. J5C2022]
MKTGMIPDELRVEYMQHPLGIDKQAPRFSWKAKAVRRGMLQTAYQIMVSGSEEELLRGSADMWDSGIVKSSQSVNMAYSGLPLVSDRPYYWKVRIWDETGTASSFSLVQTFETGLMHAEDWVAQWLRSPGGLLADAAPMFRKVFRVDKPVKRARAYIAAVGYYELSVNGRKVGDYVLDPGFTDVRKRVLYSTYDVDGYLRQGDNAIGIVLGFGWHQVPERPQVLLQLHLEYEDGTAEKVTTDRTSGWRVCITGPLLKNSIYNGEVYDARREIDGWNLPDYDAAEQEWREPILIEPPEGKLVSQLMEPIKAVDDIRPISISNPEQGVRVYDLGQNIAGWARLKVRGAAGTTITLKFAENVHSDGTINRINLYDVKAEDIYILKGEGTEEYEPRFTYHGFQYIQVEGDLEAVSEVDIIGRVVRSSVEQTGYFRCGNELLNRIQQNVLWTEMGNMHGIPTDCPQRNERMGWLNDVTVRSEEAVYNFDMSRFYAKWIDDIADTQGVLGSITDTAPFKIAGNRPADPISSSYLIVPWLLYLHYGDLEIIERHYDGMKKWVDYLTAQSTDYCIEYSYWGDWCPPSSAKTPRTPGDLMSTGYYYFNAMLIGKFARLLYKQEDAQAYEQLASHIGKAFNARHLDREAGIYRPGNQSANVFPMYLDLVPDAHTDSVLQQIVQDVIERHDYHLTTGTMCTKYIMEVLSEHGYHDVAAGLAMQTTSPSWGYMVENGATTIWERMDSVSDDDLWSRNHPMFGSISSWFYKYLGGIQVDEEGPGYERFIIKPYVLDALRFVECGVKTVRGPVACRWETAPATFKLEVTIPWNSTCSIMIPMHTGALAAATILEGDQVIWKNNETVASREGIIELRRVDDHVVVTVQSGSYCFTAQA